VLNFRLVLLSIMDHLFNLLAQPDLVVCDSDLVLLASRLVHSRDVQDTIASMSKQTVI